MPRLASIAKLDGSGTAEKLMESTPAPVSKTALEMIPGEILRDESWRRQGDDGCCDRTSGEPVGNDDGIGHEIDTPVHIGEAAQRVINRRIKCLGSRCVE